MNWGLYSVVIEIPLKAEAVSISNLFFPYFSVIEKRYLKEGIYFLFIKTSFDNIANFPFSFFTSKEVEISVVNSLTLFISILKSGSIFAKSKLPLTATFCSLSGLVEVNLKSFIANFELFIETSKSKLASPSKGIDLYSILPNTFALIFLSLISKSAFANNSIFFIGFSNRKIFFEESELFPVVISNGEILFNKSPNLIFSAFPFIFNSIGYWSFKRSSENVIGNSYLNLND